MATVLRPVDRLPARLKEVRRVGAVGASVATFVFGTVAAGCGIDATHSRDPKAPPAVQVKERIDRPVDLSTYDGSLWVLRCSRHCRGDGRDSRGETVKVPGSTGRVLSRTVVGDPQAIAAGEGAIWIANFWDSAVQRIDPDTGRVVATIRLSLPRPIAGDDNAFLPGDVAVGEGGVWVSTARGHVAHIDPSENRVVRMFDATHDAAGTIVAGDGAVWLGESQLGVRRFDPDSGRSRLITIEGADGRRLTADSLTLGNGSLWVSGTWSRPEKDQPGNAHYVLTNDSAVAEIHTDSGTVGTITELAEPAMVSASARGSLWLSGVTSPAVYRLAAGSRRLTAHRVSSAHPLMAALGSKIWIATRNGKLRSLRSDAAL